MLEGLPKKPDLVIPYEDSRDVVALDSDEYQFNRIQIGRATLAAQDSFGKSVITELFEADREKAAKEVQSKLAVLADKGGIARQEFNAFLREVLFTPKVVSHPSIQEITRGLPGHPNAQALILDAIRDRRLPYELVRQMVEVHRANYRKACESFTTELPRLEIDFKAKLASLIHDPRHPLTEDMIDIEQVDRRLAEAAFIMADPLDIMSGSKNTVIGEYAHDKNYAAMTYDRPWARGIHMDTHTDTYAHEAAHILSGRTINTSMVGVRIGLRMTDISLGKSSYRWLNEAITETLARDLNDAGMRSWNKGSYIPERALYQQFLKKIPEELFLRAYFTNADPRKPRNGLGPIRELFEAIDQAYGYTSFLSILEIMIRRNGVEYVMKCFTPNGEWRP